MSAMLLSSARYSADASTPAAPSRRLEVAREHLHQSGGRFGFVNAGVIAGRYDELGRPAVRVLEQKDGHDRPGGESVLVLERKLHLLALESATGAFQAAVPPPPAAMRGI
jgi:hypothetical protein